MTTRVSVETLSFAVDLIALTYDFMYSNKSEHKKYLGYQTMILVAPLTSTMTNDTRAKPGHYSTLYYRCSHLKK